MSVLFLLVPVVLLVVLAAVITFVWAARRGQFDDLTTPAIRVALEDDSAPSRSEPDLVPPANGD